MTDYTELEERVVNKSENLLLVSRKKREERYAHLLDENHVADTDMTLQEAEDLFRSMVSSGVDPENVGYGILELYYNYRPETEANRDTLLASASYAVLNKLLGFEDVTRKDVAEQYDVSASVVSDYSLDMLEHRFFRPEVKKAMARVEEIVQSNRTKPDESSVLSGLGSSD